MEWSPELEARRERTHALDQRLSAMSKDPKSPFGLFTYSTMRGCQLKELMQNDCELHEYVKDFKKKYVHATEPKNPVLPLDTYLYCNLRPSDAMMGGMQGNMFLLYSS